MSRLDQSRPSKRLKHTHTATNGRELPNGVGALLDSQSGLHSGKNLKAKLSNDKIKNSRIAQLDESRTVVQANGDVEMQDQTADIIEISSDARSSSADSLVNKEEEDTEAARRNGVQENDHEMDGRGKKAGSRTEDQNGALHQRQSLKSTKRSKRTRDEDAANGANGDDGKVQTTSQTAPQDTNDTDKDTMNEGPTFGELLQAQAPAEPIDVNSALATGENNNTKSLTNRKDQAAGTATSDRSTYNGPITANSLGTVLTQALRTNDNDLLESCLGLTDYAGVRATIERLPSHLAATLLLRLAERLHRRPGRAGNLMIWVQWSLVAHGGYLASQTETVAKLSILRRVVRERADGLQPLLRLKGKLDMLAAQLELRKKMKQKRPERGTGADDDDDDEDEDDEGIIYVEGAERDDDDDDDGDNENNLIVDDDDDDEDNNDLPKPGKRKAKKRKPLSKNMTSNPNTTTTSNNNINKKSEESSSEIDAMPTTTATSSLANDRRKGGDEDDIDGEQDEDNNSDENLVDDEAEETDRDTGDDDDDDDDLLSDGSDLDGFIDDEEDLDDDDLDDEDD